MISVTPQGQIYLCKTPLENDYKNQLTFNNLNSQLNYFNSTIQETFDNYTYIKKDNMIKVGINIDKIINCNYLFYKNKGVTEKYYFCFITRMEYDNENCTKIYFETDAFQTWQHNLIYKQCFVEREHVNSDNIGEHTLPENVETGDYIYQKESNFDYGDFYICVALSEDILRQESNISHNTYNGVASGLVYVVLKTQVDLDKIIFLYNEKGKIDAINSVFMIPEGYVLPIAEWKTDATGTINYIYVSTKKSAFDLGNISINRPYQYIGETIDDNAYRPKNNKLFTFPYCYLEATNNVGVNVVYRFEDFKGRTGSPWYTIYFDAKGTINAGCSIKFIPENYKNLVDNTYNQNYNEGIVGAKIPVGGWINDVYANWLRQNGLNIGINLIGNILQIGAGIGLSGTGAGSLAGGGQIASGVSGIANTIGSIYQHSLVPNQAEGNTNSSDINYSLGKSGLTLYVKTIKQEYAKIIDNYFTMFGYKVNTLKVPNINGRPYWNFVKTIDCNFDGDIPQNDLQIIRSMFNNGVTLWHNANSMYNYSLDNSLNTNSTIEIGA